MAKKSKGSKKLSPGNSFTGNTPLLSPLELQKMMAQAIASMLGDDSSPEQDEAERLLGKASRARSPKQAERLAHEALAADPAFLEAYEFLADLAPTPEEAIALLETGLQAGEKLLGKKMFKEGAGNFWLIHETRPYMRLRQQLATQLWHSGRRDEGILHIQEMLRLNPNDNQGLRDFLAGWYLEQGRLEDTERLLQQFPEDDSAWWTYSRALLTFCREGASERAGQELRQAEVSNEFLARYLAGIDIISLEQPDCYSPGDENEGMIFARYYLPAWRGTPGALAWLRKTLKLGDGADTKQLGPELFEATIATLPQVAEEVWEIDARQLDEEMEVDGELCRPWVFLAIENGTQNLLQIGCSCAYYSEEEILDLALESMLNPIMGEPRRPGKLVVNSSPLSKALYKKLKKAKVRCEFQPELAAVEELLATRLDFIRHFAQGIQGAPGDLDLADLRELPQDLTEVWQLDWRPLPVWVGSGEEAASLAVMLIVDAGKDLVPGVDIQSDPQESPRPDQSLLKAISFPMVGEPRRPGVVQVRTEEAARALRETLEELDIRLEETGDLDSWDEAFASLAQSIGGGGQQRPALAELSGATTDQINGVFAAVADFYRAAPWRLVVGDSVIRIDAPSLSTVAWFACVMGQMGETFGVALYEDEQYVQELLREQNPDPSQSMRGCSSLVLMYGEKHEAAPQDAAVIYKRRLPLAAPEAYPTVMRVKPGMAIQKPLVWEVKLMEAVLRAIPAYLKMRKRDGQTVQVAAFGQTVAVTLQFV